MKMKRKSQNCSFGVEFSRNIHKKKEKKKKTAKSKGK